MTSLWLASFPLSLFYFLSISQFLLVSLQIAKYDKKKRHELDQVYSLHKMRLEELKSLSRNLSLSFFSFF